MVVVGSGASAVFFLNQIATHVGILGDFIDSITVLEKSGHLGCGMPYNPETTDIYNLSNISSEEIPELPQTFHEWLLTRSEKELEAWGIEPGKISETEVYRRLPLGAYLSAQFRALVTRIESAGIPVTEKTRCNVTDIVPDRETDQLRLETSGDECMAFDSVVISTGHSWNEEDDTENGYYGSPWPISKIIPGEGLFHNFRIGTLGASLSAFDVVASLSHRHGDFRENEDGLSYHPYPGTDDFRLVLHSASGWLPHLQYDQDEPFRVIYRHVDRERMLALRDSDGWLRLATYFDEVCRPALRDALSKDGLDDIVEKLENPGFSIEDFVEEMSEKHHYPEAFDGMREELGQARKSVEDHKPIHWKEVVDDLLYTLNFHAELMPAEDHIVLKKTVMPFLMNVIAAMPLPSARMLLALHDAGKLELITGHVSLEEGGRSGGKTTVSVSESGMETEETYQMFIDCSGQKPLELDHYPFDGLVKTGRVRCARAEFVSEDSYRTLEKNGEDEHLFREDSKQLLHTGGIDIDAAYRVVGLDGEPNSRVFDLAFPHTSGVRPYSYGLQACNATAELVVGAWLEAIEEHTGIDGGLEEATERYVEI